MGPEAGAEFPNGMTEQAVGGVEGDLFMEACIASSSSIQDSISGAISRMAGILSFEKNVPSFVSPGRWWISGARRLGIPRILL
jgi:hypothetical protein